jgi:hypothetical protein
VTHQRNQERREPRALPRAGDLAHVNPNPLDHILGRPRVVGQRGAIRAEERQQLVGLQRERLDHPRAPRLELAAGARGADRQRRPGRILEQRLDCGLGLDAALGQPVAYRDHCARGEQRREQHVVDVDRLRRLPDLGAHARRAASLPIRRCRRARP